MELPTTWFSAAPGTLTETEVRLFTLLMVYHHLTADDAVLGGWIQRVLASAGPTTPAPDVQLLSNAAKHRGRPLRLVANALAGLPGAGKIASPPSEMNLTHYLNRLVVRGAKKAADRRPLLGPTNPCGVGNRSRFSHAARRVAELLNGPDRETFADALIEHTESDDRSPLKAEVKAQRDRAAAATQAATTDAKRARNALSQSKCRLSVRIEHVRESTQARADKRIAVQVRERGQRAHPSQLLVVCGRGVG